MVNILVLATAQCECENQVFGAAEGKPDEFF